MASSIGVIDEGADIVVENDLLTAAAAAAARVAGDDEANRRNIRN
jgi:hypothetical protein